MSKPTLKQCCRQLSQVSSVVKGDKEWFEQLAKAPALESDWSPRTRFYAYQTVKKYTRQLTAFGVDFTQIKEPDPIAIKPATTASVAAAVTKATLRTVKLLKRGEYSVEFTYDKALVDAIKLIPYRNRQWNPEGKNWLVNFKDKVIDGAAVAAFNSFLSAHQFTVSAEVTKELTEFLGLALTQEKDREKAFKRSFDTEADVTIPGLVGELRGFQKAGVAYAIGPADGRCFIADEMGLGKTVQAIGVMLIKQAYPALIVTRCKLRLNWAKELRKWAPDLNVTLDPRDMNLGIYRVLVLHYDVMAKWYDLLEGIEWKAIILDESQNIKNNKAQRTIACKDLAKFAKPPIRLCLTGTPIDNAPYEFAPQITFLDQWHSVGGSKFFYEHFCQSDRRGAANLGELNARLRKACYIRRLKKDVLKELPPKQRTVVTMELDNRKEYESAKADLVAFLKGERGHTHAHDLIDIEEEDISGKVNAAPQLVLMAALRRVCLRGKLAGVKEWVEDFIESGEKLVIFAHHKFAQREIYQLFKDVAVYTQSGAGAQAAVDRFQTDPTCKVIVCSLMADNAGHTLTAASNVAFVEMGWTPTLMDQAEDRCHRIGQTDAVMAWYLNATESIDDMIYALIQEKREIVTAATDGNKEALFSSLQNELLKRLVA